MIVGLSAQNRVHGVAVTRESRGEPSCRITMMSKTVTNGGGGVGGTTWYGAVLGDSYRGRRYYSASTAAAAGSVSSSSSSAAAAAAAAAMTMTAGRKSSTSARPPKTPRPARALQMFACVKRGVQSVYSLTERTVCKLRSMRRLIVSDDGYWRQMYSVAYSRNNEEKPRTPTVTFSKATYSCRLV